MSGKTMRSIGVVALVAIVLMLVCSLPCQIAYAQEGNLLDDLTSVDKTTQGKVYLTNETVSGNFVAEVDFCIASFNPFGTFYFGLTFYQNTDTDGHTYGYSANIQAKSDTSPTNLASFYYDNDSAKFLPMQTTNGTMGKVGQRETLRIAVNNGIVSTYLIVNGEVDIRNTYDLSSLMMRDDLLDGKTYLDSGKIGILVDEGITVNIYDIAVYEYDGFFANEVDKRIESLPENIAYADKAFVASVRGAYDALTDVQKSEVKGYEKLVNAENAIVKIGNDMVDGLIAKINALPSIEDVATLGEQLDQVKQNYSDMDKELKVRVTNYSSVAGQETRYATLKEIKRQADERIKKVVDAIDALPQLNVLVKNDEEAVRKAKALYDELIDEEKAQVGNIERLNSALSAIEDMEIPQESDSAKIAFIVLLSLAVATCIACIVLYALGKKGKKSNED